MLTMDDILPLIRAHFDEGAIARLFGEKGQRSSDELEVAPLRRYRVR
jgi:hypothetical protein